MDEVEAMNKRLEFYTRRLVRVKEFSLLESGLLRIEGDFTVEQLTDLIGVLLDGQAVH